MKRETKETKMINYLRTYGRIFVSNTRWKVKVYGAFDWGKADRRCAHELVTKGLIEAVKITPSGTEYAPTEKLLRFFQQHKNFKDFMKEEYKTNEMLTPAKR